VFADVYKIFRGESAGDRMEIAEEIKKLNQPLTKARVLLMDEKIEADDYKVMKKECEDKLKRLELSLSNMTRQKSNIMSIDRMVQKAIDD
jgi:site-specific DNA recombinase